MLYHANLGHIYTRCFFCSCLFFALFWEECGAFSIWYFFANLYLYRTPSSWDPHDDMMLRHLKEQQKLGWKEIAVHFPNRTTNACQFRWRRLMSGTLRSSSGGGSGMPGVGAAPAQAHHHTASSGASPVSTPSSAHQLRYMESATATPSPTTPGGDHHMLRTAYPDPRTGNWSRDEDELILARSDLRVEELSLLLPQRNETEIWHRRGKLLESTQGALKSAPPAQYSGQPHQYQHQHGNYAVQHSQQYSSTRRSSVDPVTLLPPVNQALPPGHQQQGLQPPKLHSKKSSSSPFDGLRLPLPVSQTRRPGQSREGSSNSGGSTYKGY